MPACDYKNKEEGQRRMPNVIEFLDVYAHLSEPNRFAVLVYARLKLVRQMAELCKPYVQERRSSSRVKFPRAHWMS